MDSTLATALERLSRRYRVEARPDMLRLVADGARDDSGRRRRWLVRGVALAGSVVFLAAGLPAPDGALQWLLMAPLAALGVAFGVVWGMPSRVLFARPTVAMVRATLEIAAAPAGADYRGHSEAVTIVVDGTPLRGDAAHPLEVHVRRLEGEVFLVLPTGSIFVENFRTADSAADFVYYLSTAIGVRCEEVGVVPRPRVAGLPWHSPGSIPLVVRPYNRDGFVLLVVFAALAFAIFHVAVPAKDGIPFALRCAGYVLVDVVVQDVLFVWWIRREVEHTLRASIGIRSRETAGATGPGGATG